MVSQHDKTLLRAFVRTFPPLKLALQVNDCICYVVQSIFAALSWLAKSLTCYVFKSIKGTVKKVARCLNLDSRAKYERLGKEKRPHDEPLPHLDDPKRWFLTYYGGLALGAMLYLFVYYVLIKHHSYSTIAIALLLMLAYMIVVENSHSIRSILMLCLPIMLTNRGRALVFCCMLAIMVAGPIKNSQINISELHASLNCCKQFLIVKTDKFVDQNIIQHLVSVEDFVYKIVDDIKEFAQSLKERFRLLMLVAITAERYIVVAIKKLKEIVDVCNVHTRDVYNNCLETFTYAYSDCQNKLGSKFDFLCEIVKPLTGLCNVVKLPDALCYLPRELIRIIDEEIGKRLEIYLRIIENEFYVHLEPVHEYNYNETESKSFKDVISEINFDVKRKFWYIHLVVRVFNLVSLILVIWILITATLYHMHYLTEINYDNMYLDGFLEEIDERRKRKGSNISDKAKTQLETIDESTETSDSGLQKTPSEGSSEDEVMIFDQQVAKRRFLLPMRPEHESEYLKPFSLSMNEAEKSKLCIAGLVWTAIVGYIGFFVLLDYSLFELIQLVDETLKRILFASDLPLVDVTSKSGDEIVRYNRTYLAQLQSRRRNSHASRMFTGHSSRNGSLSSIYRRLMDSVEQKIPDDVFILDSLETCLPKPSTPGYVAYRNLLYLALFTLTAVVVEAYALRTRHCVANLYYPKRARRRALWLYKKLLSEKAKFNDHRVEEVSKKEGFDPLALAFKVVEHHVKRG